MSIPMRCMMPLFLIASILLVCPACGEDSSPAGPDGGGEPETVTLKGRQIFKASNRLSSPSQIRITGAGIDTTFVSFNSFTLTDVPSGTYTVTVTLSEQYSQQLVVIPTTRTVTASSGTVETDPFVVLSQSDKQFYEENSLGAVYGRISGIDTSRDEFHISLTTPEGEIVDAAQTTAIYWLFDIPYGTYRITPTHPTFEFDPPYRTITLDDICTVAYFTATYTGPELHIISARVVSDVQDFHGYLDVLTQDGFSMYMTSYQQEETGYTFTPPLMPGEYVIQITGTIHGDVNPSDWERSLKIPVILSDHDIDLGIFVMRYIGPMYYRVWGTVTDAAGNGIEGVTITMKNTVAPTQHGFGTRTAESGAYSFPTWQYFTREDLDVTVTAAKTGWVFDPPSINLTHAYERTLSWVEFTADFTASPAEPVTTQAP